ncbi:SEP and UBX domain-containing protein [Phanerochaete sordida]|uniref:SEP and UBX domain-containing protein n=1 Tax=Phanerochaete sordida TaxID=48140 RepID=A0A9P3LHR8_9APHY|nr:SEP and UBX domain-containing protein [Phanerochaete sordida]
MSDSGSGRNTPSGWKRPANTGPRIGRLGDVTGPAPSSSSGGRRIATLRDVGSGGGGPSAGGFGGARHDDDDDDEDDEGPDPQTFFAGGGERSGVSIQGPPGRGPVPGGDVVRDLLRRAAEAGPPPMPAPGPARSVFSGGGHVLGGEDVETRYVPDPTAQPQDEDAPTAIRRITFWREGFSVDHDDVTGELRRYDDPAHAQILREINEGRAPPSILNILPGQPVELRIAKRTHEDYVPPTSTGGSMRAFIGTGNRLGSPVPGQPSASSTSAASMPGGFPASAGASASAGSGGADKESVTTRFEVDNTLPTTRVQVRLADGTRLTARMNLTHRVSDLRGFVDASSPGTASRPYTLNTAHPVMKPLENEELTIEQAGLANSVVVQRWI